MRNSRGIGVAMLSADWASLDLVRTVTACGLIPTSFVISIKAWSPVGESTSVTFLPSAYTWNENKKVRNEGRWLTLDVEFTSIASHWTRSASRWSNNWLPCNQQSSVLRTRLHLDFLKCKANFSIDSLVLFTKLSVLEVDPAILWQVSGSPCRLRELRARAARGR